MAPGASVRRQMALALWALLPATFVGAPSRTATASAHSPDASDAPAMVASAGGQVLPGPVAAAAEDAASAETTRALTLAEAEATTLRLLPQLTAARAAAQAAQAKAHATRAALLPQLTAQGAYSRQTANFVLRPGSLPQSLSSSNVATTRNTSYNYWNFGLTVSQLVWDFGVTTHTLTAANLAAAASRDTLVDSQRQAVLATRLAYFDAANKQAQLALAEATLANQARHRTQVAQQVQVGQRAPIDLASVATDVANADVARINAHNAWRTAQATLRQCLGVEGLGGDFALTDDVMAPLDDEDAPLEALHAAALAHRPDYAVQRAGVAQAEASRRASRSGLWPTLSASAGVTEAGQQIDHMGWNWNVGGQVSWSLFDGGRTYANLRQAQALAAQAQAQTATLRQSLRSEVEKNRLAVHAARALCAATQVAADNAAAQLRLAEGRYQKGLGQIIELNDAQLAASSAAATSLNAKYGLAQARANLASSLGR